MRDHLHHAAPMHHATRKPLVVVMVLAALSVTCGTLHAASLRITSPANGARVYSGRTLTVKVDASSGPFRTVGLLGSAVWNRIYTLTAPPYEFAVPIPPGTASDTYSLVAVGTTTAGETVQSERINVDVERPDPPLRIWNEVPGLSLPYAGHTMWLQVSGKFADGSRVTLTYSSLTTYVSDNPAVVAVDSTGLVTAVGPGSAKITITNVGEKIVVPVDVADEPPPDKTKH